MTVHKGEVVSSHIQEFYRPIEVEYNGLNHKVTRNMKITIRWDPLMREVILEHSDQKDKIRDYTLSMKPIEFEALVELIQNIVPVLKDPPAGCQPHAGFNKPL